MGAIRKLFERNWARNSAGQVKNEQIRLEDERKAREAYRRGVDNQIEEALEVCNEFFNKRFSNEEEHFDYTGLSFLNQGHIHGMSIYDKGEKLNTKNGVSIALLNGGQIRVKAGRGIYRREEVDVSAKYPTVSSPKYPVYEDRYIDVGLQIHTDRKFGQNAFNKWLAEQLLINTFRSYPMPGDYDQYKDELGSLAKRLDDALQTNGAQKALKREEARKFKLDEIQQYRDERDHLSDNNLWFNEDIMGEIQNFEDIEGVSAFNRIQTLCLTVTDGGYPYSPDSVYIDISPEKQKSGGQSIWKANSFKAQVRFGSTLDSAKAGVLQDYLTENSSITSKLTNLFSQRSNKESGFHLNGQDANKLTEMAATIIGALQPDKAGEIDHKAEEIRGFVSEVQRQYPAYSADRKVSPHAAR